MMGTRKAQMTTFIILGVVIVLFSSLGFFLYKQVAISGFEKKVDTVAQQMRITALDNYVESCLREALLENLDAVGLRGGFLEEIPHPFDSGRGTISAAIPPLEQYNEDILPAYPPPPAYPNRIVDSIEQEFHIQPIRPYPFGGRSLRKLCQTGGPNDVPLHEFARPCPGGSYGDDSIQKDLNVRVAQGLEACINETYIEEITGYAVDAAAPIVSVIFGEEDVRAEAEYPINISLEEGTAVRTFDFATDISVRIKKTYGLAQHIINNDRFYVTYNKRDMESAEWRSEFWDRAMTVDVNCPRCLEGDTTDVVTITDTRSNLDGKYFLFRFAITDRIPVLEPIRGPSAAVESGEETHFVATIPLEPIEIHIAPFALDPDEDDLYVYYRGWMQDYIEIRGRDGQFSLSNFRPPGVSRPFAPLLESSPCRLEANFDERPADCDQTIVVHPSIFERSGDAWNEIFNPHEGLHELTVIVCDKPITSFPEDLDDDGEHKEHCDWQDVRIRVGASAAESEAGIECYYEDADAGACITREDPFILTTTGSAGTFTWTSPRGESFPSLPSRAIVPDDLMRGSIFSELCGLPEIAHLIDDDDPGCESPATRERIMRNRILWILWFHGRYIFHDTGEEQAWTFDAGGTRRRVRMNVKDCMPYESSNPAYPYNLPGDPFLATHTCCGAGGTIKQPTDRDNTCYSGTTYGPPDVSTLARGAHDNAANDVYEKTVTHLCDGVRGNICASGGEKTELITPEPLRVCRDFIADWQVERCEGPSVTTRPGTDILTYACKQYDPGESFEKEFGLDKRGSFIAADGNCDGSPDYADGGGAGMFDPTTDSGPFRCDGQCNAGACDYAANCVCDSTSPSGAGDSACDGITYSALAASAGRGVVAAGGALCDIQCRVVGPDQSEAACRAAIDTDPTKTWNPQRFSAGRSGSERCCGDRTDEFLPSGSGARCCSELNSCVIGGECVAPGSTDTSGMYYCDAGVSKRCTITNECEQAGTKYCAGSDGWIDAPGSPVIGRSCGGAGACGTCREHTVTREIQCLADDSRCTSGMTCNADLQCV